MPVDHLFNLGLLVPRGHYEFRVVMPDLPILVVAESMQDLAARGIQAFAHILVCVVAPVVNDLVDAFVDETKHRLVASRAHAALVHVLHRDLSLSVGTDAGEEA